MPSRGNCAISLHCNFYVTFVVMKKYRTVIRYKNYFDDFLRAQRPKVVEKILQTLRMVEVLERIPATHLKHIEDTNGLFEIRVQFGNDIFRVFCFFDDGRLVVLLSGFQKKTQRTPRQEIEKAVGLMNNYYNEKKEEAKNGR